MGMSGFDSILSEINTEKKHLETYISAKKAELIVEFHGMPTSQDIYDGEYTVIPKFIQQELDTTGKLMADDVEVLAIPVEKTINLSGGYTVVIGG